MRQLLVLADKNFRITIPDDAKVTFGPWSPPNANKGYRTDNDRNGTLRIYKGTKDNIIACFAGVHGFRDLSMGYAEEVAREEGATIWKDDEKGYTRESKVKMQRDWIEPERQLSTAKKVKVPSAKGSRASRG